MAGNNFPSLLFCSLNLLLAGIPRCSSEPSIDFQMTLWMQGKNLIWYNFARTTLTALCNPRDRSSVLKQIFPFQFRSFLSFNPANPNKPISLILIFLFHIFQCVFLEKKRFMISQLDSQGVNVPQFWFVKANFARYFDSISFTSLYTTWWSLLQVNYLKTTKMLRDTMRLIRVSTESWQSCDHAHLSFGSQHSRRCERSARAWFAI